MPNNPIEIEVDDLVIQRALSRLTDRMRNMKPAMESVGRVVKDAVLTNFEREGRPKWKPLSPVTKALRGKRGHWGKGSKILDESGGHGLVGSLHIDATDHDVSVYTAKIYAAVQHFGAKKGSLGKGTKTVKGRERKWIAPWGDIPARPFMRLTAMDRKRITRRLNEIFAATWEGTE